LSLSSLNLQVKPVATLSSQSLLQPESNKTNNLPKEQGEVIPTTPLNTPAELQRCASFPLPAKLIRRPSMDLFECIEEHDKLSEKDAIYVFKQIVEAVKYLHERGIIHRDIKDENIVIDQDMHVKLIDFGSASIEDVHKPFLDKFQGTVQYCPPEVLRGEKYKGRPADMWSLGILLYTILCGEIPFSSSEQARRHGYKPPGIDLSPEARNLLDALLQKAPCQRPTIEEVLTHEWFLLNTQRRQECLISDGAKPQNC
jgi:serine/threonine protein kinase